MIPDPLDRFPSRRKLFGPSPADRLLENAQCVRLNLLRFIDDDGRPTVSCEYRMTGCIELAPDVATGELLLAIVKELGGERREGGAQ